MTMDLRCKMNFPGGSIPDMKNDKFGRCFCAAHNREICHQCCVDHSMTNRIIEENAGLTKERTKAEKVAADVASGMSALRGMDRMHPRPSEEVYEQNRNWLKESKLKLQSLKDAGDKSVDEVLRLAIEKENAKDTEMQGFMQAWSKQNPGKTNMEFGGAETQKLYEEFIAAPSKNTRSKLRAEKWTCDFCNKTSPKKLPACARCKLISYCSKECQVAAWKTHKQVCIRLEKEPRSLPQTWEQVEAHGGDPVKGKTLEVRAVLDESMMRQVFSCKDRVGVVKRIAAYNNDRRIPGLRQGSVLRWKNPRFHYFMDGSSGARIEEADLPNLKVINK
eukprot:CAMPEP_0181091686 /NCGR_PEP_ID=MMETSP1071-20121207/8529_1 /TAXON_ID=35127 /ORGANISM="Thalassiosira sp., Strain NH16" /LENGTH=332 /DNA_ID=CAMNT_0023173839 /DNA_START=47 /DNA_END=1045 /DNA_ORIENTATION=+